VLIFKNNKIAVIYRPGTNKIVNFATDITITQSNTSPTIVQEDSREETGEVNPIEIVVSPTVNPTNTQPSPTSQSE
jgi:hypothetical protein